jgi:hypothetical protein
MSREAGEHRVTKSRAALAAAIVIPVAVVAVLVMNRGQTSPLSSNQAAASPPTGSANGSVTSLEGSGDESSGASSTAPKAGPTSRPRPTYERGQGGGIYLDLLPNEEGGGNDRDKPLDRIADGSPLFVGESPVNSVGKGLRIRISSADGTPINRTIRLGGPHAQDFSPLGPDICDEEPCRPAGVLCSSSASCYCSRSVCYLGIPLQPSAVGPRSATLFIGDFIYAYLTGFGLPEQREEQEGSTSTSSTSVTTGDRTSTSSSSGSTVPPPSTATDSPARS